MQTSLWLLISELRDLDADWCRIGESLVGLIEDYHMVPLAKMRLERDFKDELEKHRSYEKERRRGE